MKNILETTGSFCTKYIYIYYIHIEVIGSVYMGNILININKQYIYILYYTTWWYPIFQTEPHQKRTWRLFRHPIGCPLQWVSDGAHFNPTMVVGHITRTSTTLWGSLLFAMVQSSLSSTCFSTSTKLSLSFKATILASYC